MKLLIDANLSWRLCEPLSRHFTDVKHVNKIAISQPASDEAIWDFARVHDFYIVSNDEDFLNILFKNGFPPKLILLRTGNQGTTFIKDVLLKYVDDIDSLEKSEEHGFLEIYG